MVTVEKGRLVDEDVNVDIDFYVDGSATRAGAGVLDLVDNEPTLRQFYAEVVAGLGESQKSLPCKFFYDACGAKLFDAICDLPEYYPERVEIGILRENGDAISRLAGEQCRLIAYGSGSGTTSRMLLDQLVQPAAYVPIDICRSQLAELAVHASVDYPHTRVQAVCADFTHPFTLPDAPRSAERTVVYFPGSTIGNLHPEDARSLLARIAQQCGPNGGLLIGVDLKKAREPLDSAYNDTDGVTAAFNLNLLARINRELHGDFCLSAFEHYAYYNVFEGRVEMHLVSTCKQTLRVGGEIFGFRDGETVRTQCSYKYTLDEFEALADGAVLRVEHAWTDPDLQYSLQYLTVM